MYARLEYGANSYTPNNVFDDMVAVLTGTTDKNLLSGALIKADSFIDTSWSVGGWTVDDNYTIPGLGESPTGVVLKSQLADSAGTYKYLYLYCGTFSGGTYGFVNGRLYETWNNLTHSGVNPTDYLINPLYWTASYPARMVLNVSASPRHVATYYTYGNFLESSGSMMIWCTEFKRNNLWDTVANAYRPIAHVAMNTAYLNGGVPPARSPRLYDSKNDVDVLGGNLFLSTVFGVDNYSVAISTIIGGNIESRVADANKIKKHSLIPIGLGNPIAYGFFPGDFSEYTEIYLTTYGQSYVGDVLINGADNYVIWKNDGGQSGFTFAVRMG